MEMLLIAFLWRIGGAGWPPFGKDWRRWCVPTVVLFSCLFRGYSELQAVLCAVFLFTALRLPLTLRGDSLYHHWLNWPWVWIAGYLLGLASVVTHGWHGFLLALIPAIAQGVSVTLSNIPATAKDFPHEACEILTACAVALIICPQGC